MSDITLLMDGGRKEKRKWFTKIEGKATPETLYKNTQPTNKIASLNLIRTLNFKFLEGNSDGVYIELMVSADKITTVDKPLYHYRIRSNSISSKFSVKHIKTTVESCRFLLENCKKFKKYYEFKFIEALLQLLYVSAREGDKATFESSKKELTRLNYQSNPYMKTLLKKESSQKVFFAIMYILPVNYYISYFLVNYVYKKMAA